MYAEWGIRNVQNKKKRYKDRTLSWSSLGSQDRPLDPAVALTVSLLLWSYCWWKPTAIRGVLWMTRRQPRHTFSRERGKMEDVEAQIAVSVDLHAERECRPAK